MRVWSRVTLVRFSPWTIFLSDNLQSIIVSLNGVNQRPKKAKTRWKLNLQEFCEDTVSPNLNKPNTIGINSPDQERMLLHFFGRPRPLLAATPGLVLVRSVNFCLHAWNWLGIGVCFVRTLSCRPSSSSSGSTKTEFSESSGSNTDLTAFFLRLFFRNFSRLAESRSIKIFFTISLFTSFFPLVSTSCLELAFAVDNVRSA